MKKFAALLLALVLVFSFASCDEEQDNTTTTTTTQPSGGGGEEPPEEAQKYYHVEQIDLNTTRYSLYDFLGNEVLTAETDRPLNISMRGKWVVDIEIGMGTGISTHRYYHVLHNFFSEEYTYVIAATENLVAYMQGPLEARQLVVRDFFDTSAFYKEFHLVYATGHDGAIERAEFMGEQKLTVTYVSGDTQRFSIRDEYERVIKMYRGVINLCQDYLDERDGKTDFAERFGIANKTEKEMFDKLFMSSYLFYPGRGAEDRTSPHYKLSAGYAIMDLNGDGVDELVILNADYVVGAIFSLADGKPILLRNYQPRDRAWIDANGWIHENGSSGADHSTNAVYKLVSAKGGPTLELVAEFGTNGHEWIDGEDVTQYYKIVNGEWVDITKDEHDALEEQYGEYLSVEDGAERTKNESGLVFTALFTQADIDAELEAALTPEDALRIASEYWNVEDGFTEGAAGTTIVHRIVLTEEPSTGFIYYHIVWRMEYWWNISEEELEGDRMYHVEDYKGLFVNLYTGNCYDDPLISNDYPDYGK